jgi:hypothetical protein
MYNFSLVHLLPATTALLRVSNLNARKQNISAASFLGLLSAILRLFPVFYWQCQPVCPALACGVTFLDTAKKPDGMAVSANIGTQYARLLGKAAAGRGLPALPTPNVSISM